MLAKQKLRFIANLFCPTTSFVHSFQFALDENDAVKVVDLDGLMPIPFGDTRVCNGSCEHNCYRGAKYDAVRVRILFFKKKKKRFAV
jgi:hypothetical protein